MSVKIIVDSTADLPQKISSEFTVVPLTIRFEDREYVDGVDIDRKTFYEKLIECDILPQTSQATPAQFDACFSALQADEEAVVLTVSSGLSGTYQSATIAAAEYADRVFVVDTKSVAIGGGILAERALQLKNQGLSAKQIAERIESEKEDVCVIALLDTLEYLKKGGRISPATAFAGGLLSIKPVACIEDGRVKMIGKARGSKQGNNLLVKQINDCGGIDFSRPLLLGYTGITDVFLKKYIEDSRYLWEDALEAPRYSCIGSVVGTHVGPGAVAAAFFKKSE